jgi:fatty acid-binding protein DegV
VFGADAPDMDSFLTLLAGITPRDPVLMGDIGPVIGTHAGPGAVGAAWIAEASR